MTINLNSLEDTKDFAKKLAPMLKPGDVLTFSGDLGSGKTTLIRDLIQYFLGPETDVTSPSFNLVHLYDTKNFPIWHIDLYRLEHEEELVELGLDEAFDQAICFIEWPERAPDYLPKERLLIEIFYGKEEEQRRIALTGKGKWQERITSLHD